MVLRGVSFSDVQIGMLCVRVDDVVEKGRHDVLALTFTLLMTNACHQSWTAGSNLNIRLLLHDAEIIFCSYFVLRLVILRIEPASVR